MESGARDVPADVVVAVDAVIVEDPVSIEAAAMDHVADAVGASDPVSADELEHPSTPRSSSKENLKPRIGMIFDTLTDVEDFYKSYAHEAGFSVRVGQHKKQNEEILFKR